MSQSIPDTTMLRLIACPSLALEHGKIDRYVTEGATVAGHLRAIGWQPDGLFARVFIDGTWIDKAQWEYAVPRAGQALTIRVIPMGGGENGKTALRIVAMIAVVVASIYTAGAAGAAFGSFFNVTTATGGAIAGAAVSIIGTLAITMLIPPSRPRLEDLSGQGVGSPTLSLTGSSNQFSPYGPVPRVYGEHLLYPTLAALPITEIVGTDQYLRLLFCCGYGPLVLEDFKIGTTPLKQFKNVQKEIRYGYPDDAPVTLYPRDIYEEGLAVALTSAGGRQVRRSQLNAQALSVDIAFPEGLVDYDEKGVAGYRTVQVEVVYRKVPVPPDDPYPPEFGWIVAGATPAVAATGYRYGLTYTAVEQGTDGNSIMITFVPFISSHGGITPISVAFVFLKTIGAGIRQVIQIRYHPGISTASQIRDVFNSSACASMATAFVTTDQTMPPYPPGTPAISPLYLKGGVDFVASLQATEKSPQLQRRSLKWNVEPGFEYDVGLRRMTADTTDTTIRDAVVWTTLRTIQTAGALYPPGMAMIAMRIKATDQLNGTVNQFNCIAKSILPDWDGTDWIPQPTSNPASIYRDVIQGSANRRPKADSRLDLPTIQDFHERCTAEGFTFNAVIDFRTTVKQLRQDVLAVGRGAFGLRDMKYSVIQDLIQATPVDVITPRTSFNFKWSKRFLDPIHAFRVRYVDEEEEWQQGERVVYADGYDATNATLFEDVDAGLGVTNKEQVYKLKKRELASAYLRADDYSVEMDFAHLTVTRGDRVQLQHDVILAGLLSARIIALTGGGDITEMRVDNVLTMVDGTLYAARIKYADGTQRVEPLVTIQGEQSVVTFVTPIPVAFSPSPGDLVLFGLLGSESLDCIVKAIVPGADYAATVVLLDYAPAIQTADSGEIPPWESHVTVPPNQRLLATPILVSIVSDETVLVRQSDGALESRIVVFLAFKSGVGLPAAYLQVQFRESGSEDTWQQIHAPVSGSSAKISIIPVEDGVTYDIQIRSVASDQSGAPGATSEWLTIDDYLVIGKTAPPPDVLTFVRDGETLTWAYPDPPPDFAGFRIRRHFGSRFSWEDAQPIHEGIITGTLWPLPGDLDVMTYLIKAVDTGDHESAQANYLTVNLGSLLVDNLLFTEDKKAASFPGTHNGVLNAGNLEANTASTFWSSTDTALFWSGTDANNFWVSQYRALEYITSLIPDADKVPCTLLLDLTVIAQFYTLEYRVTGSARFWSGVDATAFWSGTDSTLAWSGNGLNDGWLPWLGLVQQATRQVYEWRVMTAPGPVKGEITKYLIKVDVPDVVEPFKDVVIAVTTGTRLTLTKSYRAIKNVELNLVNDAGTALTATIEDYGTGGPPLTAGPLIKTRDAARVAVAGKISGRIQGY